MKRENISKASELNSTAKKLERFIAGGIETTLHELGDVAYLIGTDRIKPIAKIRLEEILKEIEELC